MKKLVTILFILISYISHAQTYDQPKNYGLEYRRVKVDTAFNVPNANIGDTVKVNPANRKPGTIAYSTTIKKFIYSSDGHTYDSTITGGGGTVPVVQDLQSVTDVGKNTTTGISIGTVTGNYFTDSIVVQGTSIEYGTTLTSPSTQAWPIQMGNMLGYGVINLGVPFSTYTGNDSVYRRIPTKRTNLKYLVFGGPVNDANTYPTDTATYSAKIISVLDSLVSYKGWSYSDIYLQTPWFCYRNYRNNANYPALVIYAKCIRDIVTKKGCNLIDLFSYSYSTAGYGYTQDGIHPNYLGVQYLAQFTSGYIPKSQHNANDKFIVKGKVQFGDSIYHMTTTMAKPGSGVMLLAKDSTGREVVIPGDEYIRAANRNDIATGGGVHTTEHIVTDRGVHAGTQHLYGLGTNFSWFSENMVWDEGITSGFTFQNTGNAHMLFWAGSALNYISGGSGSAGGAVTQSIRARFNDNGAIGLGGQNDNTDNNTIAGHALQIFANKNVVIGSNTDNGYKLDVVGSFRGNRLFAANPSRTSSQTDSIVGYNPSTQELEVLPMVVSNGVYTPTATGTANTSSLSISQCQYKRIGKVVTVSGVVTVAPTTVSTLTQVTITLPIASNFTIEGNCGGSSNSINVAGECAGIIADIANNIALMQWVTNTNASEKMPFSFTYLIQ